MIFPSALIEFDDGDAEVHAPELVAATIREDCRNHGIEKTARSIAPLIDGRSVRARAIDGCGCTITWRNE